MAQPSLEFLVVAIANALLDYYGIEAPPVPVREILRSPPPDLARDLSLTEMLPFGEALWLRLMGGQGAVFVNSDLSEARRRYAMACALFIGLCSSEGGRAAGLPPLPNDNLREQSTIFGRHFLMPESLLPPGWDRMSANELADLFGVPASVAESRLQEFADR